MIKMTSLLQNKPKMQIMQAPFFSKKKNNINNWYASNDEWPWCHKFLVADNLSKTSFVARPPAQPALKHERIMVW